MQHRNLYKKITQGYVEQFFNGAGECVGQQFVAGDQVEWETNEGDPINSEQTPLTGREYHDFKMHQPPWLHPRDFMFNQTME